MLLYKPCNGDEFGSKRHYIFSGIKPQSGGSLVPP